MDPGWLIFALPPLLFGTAAAIFASVSVLGPAPDTRRARRASGWAAIFALLTFLALFAIVLVLVAISIGIPAPAPGD